MKKFELAFSFKGTRQYIHGTDMLNKSSNLLCEHLAGNLERIHFFIHRMTDRNLSMTLYPTAQAPELDVQEVAELKFVAEGKFWAARLAETESRPAHSYAYDEDAVVELCRVDEAERKVSLRVHTCYTPIEVLVAMTKALHLKVYPNMMGSWVFCRWESQCWPLPENLSGVCIQLKQALGTRLTKSEVSLDGIVLGHVYFSGRNNK